MNEKENEPIIPRSTIRHFIRVLLRSIPFLPGPELYDLIEDLRRSRTSIEQKTEKVYASLRETSTLISELEQTVRERVERLAIIRQDYERYSKLAEVEENSAVNLQDL